MPSRCFLFISYRFESSLEYTVITKKRHYIDLHNNISFVSLSNKDKNITSLYYNPFLIMLSHTKGYRNN